MILFHEVSHRREMDMESGSFYDIVNFSRGLQLKLSLWNGGRRGSHWMAIEHTTIDICMVAQNSPFAQNISLGLGASNSPIFSYKLGVFSEQQKL
jgi:hypothetical protein